MRKIFVPIAVVGFFMMAMMLGVSSCNNGSDGDNSPTTPSVPDPFVSLREEPEYTKEFWGTPVEHGFEANIPEAGDYRFVYTTNLGTFNLMLRDSSPAIVIVDLLPEHQVQKVILQKGAIIQSAAANMLQTVEVIQKATFQPDKAFGDLLLINNGNSVISRPIPTATPTPKPTPTPTPRPARPSGTVIRMVAVGDSITYGEGSSGGGYPARVESKLWKAGKNADMRNEGKPGELSPNTDRRFSSAIQGAEIALLLIGTNDIAWSGMCGGAPCLTDRHIASMMDKALAAGVTLYVSTVIPTKTFEHDADIRALNQKIYAEASKRGIKVVDNYQAIVSNGGSSLMADKLHPNDAGADVMAGAFYRAIMSGL